MSRYYSSVCCSFSSLKISFALASAFFCIARGVAVPTFWESKSKQGEASGNISHIEREQQRYHQRDDRIEKTLEVPRGDLALHGLQERVSEDQETPDLSEVAVKNNIAAAEEDKDFWLDRQEWLVEKEKELHAEPWNKEAREAILKNVAALIADAREAEGDWMEENSRMIFRRGNITTFDSLRQDDQGIQTLFDIYQKTIEAARETAELGELFLTSYKNFKAESIHDFVKDVSGNFESEAWNRYRSVPSCQSKTTSSFQGSVISRAARAFTGYLAGTSLINTPWQERAEPLRSFFLDKLPSTLSGVNGLVRKYATFGTDPFLKLGLGGIALSLMPRASAVQNPVFNVYDWVPPKLINIGVPAKQILPQSINRYGSDYYVAGSFSSTYPHLGLIARLKQSGKKEWVYTSLTRNMKLSSTAVMNETLYSAGTSYPGGYNGYYPFISKNNLTDGSLLSAWIFLGFNEQFSLNGVSAYSRIKSIFPTERQTLLCFGNDSSGLNFALDFDPKLGAVRSAYTIELSNNNTHDTLISSAAKVDEQTYIIGGSNSTKTGSWHNGWLSKIHYNGTHWKELWTRLFFGQSNTFINAVAEQNNTVIFSGQNNGYGLVGSLNGTSGNSNWFAHTKPTGGGMFTSIAFQKGSSSSETAKIIVSGVTSSGLLGGSKAAWYALINLLNGTLYKSFKIGGAGGEEASSLVSNNDGTFSLIGTTKSYSNGQNMFFATLDKNGYIDSSIFPSTIAYTDNTAEMLLNSQLTTPYIGHLSFLKRQATASSYQQVLTASNDTLKNSWFKVGTKYPTSQPSSQPSRQPSSQPSSQPSRSPSAQPTTNPSVTQKYLGNTIDLSALTSAQGAVLSGGGNQGFAVSSGDVNGDKVPDIITAAPSINKIYVLYGNRGLSNLNLDTISPAQGFTIQGPTSTYADVNSRTGYALSSADINRDGYSDIIIGSPGAYNLNALGKVYLVWGGAHLSNIDLSNLGNRGITISGGIAGDYAGRYLSHADLNHDGYPDILIGTPQSIAGIPTATGKAYVIFGNHYLPNITLANLTSLQGMTITGPGPGDTGDISGIGDINGDGKEDIMVSSPSRGSAHVIFGNETLSNINLANFNNKQGFFFSGGSLRAMANLGDLNHDGYGDFGFIGRYSIYTIFGKPNGFSHMMALSAATPPAGFTATASHIIDYGHYTSDTGRSLGGAGDVNGDGYDDLIVGDPYSSIDKKAYLIFGKANGFRNIAFDNFTSDDGIIIKQPASGIGWSTSKIGDVNNDGYSDYIIGSLNGFSYILYGGLNSPTSQPSRQPSSQPSRQPSSQPTSQPSFQPTTQPTSFISGSLKDGLVAHYPFDGNARDQSGNGNNGVVHSATLTTDRFGIPNKAYNFNGINSYIEIVDGSPFDFQNNMSVAFWVKPGGMQQNYAQIFSKSHLANGFSSWIIQQSYNSLNRYIFLYKQVSLDSWLVTTNNFLNTNQWKHYVITKGNKKLSTYINGNLVSDNYGVDFLIKRNGNFPLTIGAFNGGNTKPASGLDAFFNGTLDDIFIYNRTLTAQEILRLYQFDSPTSQPSSQPSRLPSSQPSSKPSSQPTSQPSGQPSREPSSQPSGQPTGQPSSQPSSQPSAQPSRQPSSQPSAQPSRWPSSQPSSLPTLQPFGFPTVYPTMQPSSQPSGQPSAQPSSQPSSQPVGSPSSQPSDDPTVQPTSQPSVQPSGHPSGQPSSQPSGQPSRSPSSQPSTQPTVQPSGVPSQQPSGQPSSQPSSEPTGQPSLIPTIQPSVLPTAQPTLIPTSQPSGQPSLQPSSQPSSDPTTQPTGFPSTQPSSQPSGQPSGQPSAQPSSQPVSQPKAQPSSQPSVQPTSQPTVQPSRQPSAKPSSQPSIAPSALPSVQPSSQPTGQPSSQPSIQPTGQPSLQPTARPTSYPTAIRKPDVVGVVSLLGPESPIEKSTILTQSSLLASGGKDPSSLFHFNISDGALFGRYQLPWDTTHFIMSNGAPYNNLNFLGSWKENATSSIAAAILKNNQLSGSYFAHRGIDYEDGLFHPVYYMGLAMGKDETNQTVVTFYNPRLSSATCFRFPTTISFQYIKAIAHSQTTLLAGVEKQPSSESHAINIGTLSLIPSPRIGALSRISANGNQRIGNRNNLLNVATLLTGSLDPMIAGGMDLGERMRPYLARLSSLSSLNQIVCARALRVEGAVTKLFHSENKLYALFNGFKKQGASIQSSLNIAGINSETCDFLPPRIEVTGPASVKCSDVIPTALGFEIVCTLDEDQALLFSTDRNFTFNNLPSGYRVRVGKDFSSKPLNLSIIPEANMPLKGAFFSPASFKASFSKTLEPFTQLLPEHLARYVPLPSRTPTPSPTAAPSHTKAPSFIPSPAPTLMPTQSPSKNPSAQPSISSAPSSRPSSSEPTLTYRPTPLPTMIPSASPSALPTRVPSALPTTSPTRPPTIFLSSFPTMLPSFLPSRLPSPSPTRRPTKIPTLSPTQLKRTSKPTFLRTASPMPSASRGNSSFSEQAEEPFFDTSTLIDIGAPVLGVSLGVFVFMRWCFKNESLIEKANRLNKRSIVHVSSKIRSDIKSEFKQDSLASAISQDSQNNSRSHSFESLRSWSSTSLLKALKNEKLPEDKKDQEYNRTSLSRNSSWRFSFDDSQSSSYYHLSPVSSEECLEDLLKKWQFISPTSPSHRALLNLEDKHSDDHILSSSEEEHEEITIDSLEEEVAL